MGTGIKLIITIITGTHPIPCQIIGLRVIMVTGSANRPSMGHLHRPSSRGRPIVLHRESCINTSINRRIQSSINRASASSTCHLQAHPIEHQQELLHQHVHPHQTFLHEDQVVPGVSGGRTSGGGGGMRGGGGGGRRR